MTSKSIHVSPQKAFWQLVGQWRSISTFQTVQFELSCPCCSTPVESDTWERPALEAQPPESWLQDAKESMEVHFRYCKRCHGWVCAAFCWDPIHGCCEQCQPSHPAFVITDAPISQDNSCFSSILGAMCSQCGALLDERGQCSSC